VCGGVLLNERDYLIIETMVLAGGSLVVGTIISMMLWFHIIPDVSIVLILSFIGFCTFFFGLYFHMKRRIFLLEMQRLARDHTDPQRGENEK